MSTMSRSTAQFFTWPCDIDQCTQHALIGAGNCITCGRHICGQHLNDFSKHECANPEGINRGDMWFRVHQVDTRKLIAELDLDQLCREAEFLRPGHSCTAPTEPLDGYPSPLFGVGYNGHLCLTFDDGVKWVVRMRVDRVVSPPRQTQWMSVRSEVATLRTLHHNGIKVPMAWPAPETTALDIPHFYLEYVEGHDHKQLGSIYIVEPSDATIKVIQNLALWFIALEKLSFDLAGSLQLDPDAKAYVGQVNHIVACQQQSQLSLGPFKSAKAMYLTMIENLLEQTLLGLRFPPDEELLAYLAFLEIKSLVGACKELEEGPTYVKHADDKGDHVFVNDECEITGVIDWEWVYVTAKAEAFAGPRALVNQTYYEGSNQPCAFEKTLMAAYQHLGRPDLADFVRRGKKFQRLSDILTFEIFKVEHLNATRRAFLNLPDDGQIEPSTQDEWIRLALERYKEDNGLQEITLRMQKPGSSKSYFDGG